MFKGWMATKDEEIFLENNKVQDGDWHLNGKLIEGKKSLVLGRSCYYLSLIKTLADHFKEDIYQSDFMTWDPNKTAKPNLGYYIGTAEEIHFSLRGVETEQVRQAIKEDKDFPYMTIWEIKVIFFASPELRDKVWWYTDKDDMVELLHELGVHKIRRLKFTSKELDNSDVAEIGWRYYKIK